MVDSNNYPKVIHRLSSEVDALAAKVDLGSEERIKLFQYFYSKYQLLLRNERDSSDFEMMMTKGPLASNSLMPQLQDLRREISRFPRDAFLGYLEATVLNRIGNHLLAAQVLLESLKQFPYNWSAWLEVSSCMHACVSGPTALKIFKMFSAVSGVFGVCFDFFMLQLLTSGRQFADLAPSIDVADIFEKLSPVYSEHPQIQLWRAIHYYHSREFEGSYAAFREYHDLHGFDADGADIYSNVLFLLGDVNELAALAQKCLEVDRYRPETSCAVANYYAIKADHEMAIKHFQQALRLDPTFGGVWTLLGHEYLEIGNTKAALACYRTAADYDPNDYRAWFGLGQAYEILGLSNYSIYYYQRAVAIRPVDSRMWGSLADAYEATGKLELSIKCLLRATESFLPQSEEAKQAMQEGDELREDRISCVKMWFKIAQNYCLANRFARAAVWYESAVSFDELQGHVSNEDWNDALLFVSKHYLKQKRYDRARNYLERLIQSEGVESQEAKAMLAAMPSE